MFPYDSPCEVCGNCVDGCICEACPICGEHGRPECYKEHGMEETDEQVLSKVSRELADEDYFYDGEGFV